MLDHKNVFFGPLRRSDAGGCRMGHVSHVIRAFGNIFGNHTANFLSLENGARRQVIKWKLGFGATRARHSRPCFGRLPIPENAVAGRVSHRTTAAKLIKQAAGSRSLSKLHGRLFVLKKLDASTTRLSEGLEEGLRPLQVIESDVPGPSAGNRHQDLSHPVGMAGTTRDVDDRQAPLGFEIRSQVSTVISFQVLKPDTVRGIGSVGRDASPTGTIAQGDDGIGSAANS